MRVLVTGGTSLIGRGVTARLLERGDEVVTLQRHPAAASGLDGVESIQGDVRDAALLIQSAARCDGIVHLAAKVGVIGGWPEYRSINVDGTDNVIAAARRQGVGSLVHVSSPSVAHGGEPIVGDGAEPPVFGRRRAFYAESKAIAEVHALDAVGPDLGVVAIRPHLVWGPGDEQLVGRIVDRARAGRLALVGGGRALVDTTYIDNAVDALIAALDRVQPGARCSGRAYVVTNGEPRPIRDLVSGICRAAGVEFAPRDVPTRLAAGIGGLVERVWPMLRSTDEPPITRFLAEQLGTAHWFDPRPARDDLGWTPVITIDEGLDRLRAWYSRAV